MHPTTFIDFFHYSVTSTKNKQSPRLSTRFSYASTFQKPHLRKVDTITLRNYNAAS